MSAGGRRVIKLAASTVRQIRTDADIDPASQTRVQRLGAFLRSPADVLPACDFFETGNLTRVRIYVMTVIERHELLDRSLIWNQRHLLHGLRQYEHVDNNRRPHQGILNEYHHATLTCTDDIFGKRRASWSWGRAHSQSRLVDYLDLLRPVAMLRLANCWQGLC